jgi:hypothetical protein
MLLCLVISRMELIRKDKEKFRSARKIPEKRPLIARVLLFSNTFDVRKYNFFRWIEQWYFFFLIGRIKANLVPMVLFVLAARTLGARLHKGPAHPRSQGLTADTALPQATQCQPWGPGTEDGPGPVTLHNDNDMITCIRALIGQKCIAIVQLKNKSLAVSDFNIVIVKR